MLTDASRSFAILSSSQRGVKNEIYITLLLLQVRLNMA